MKKYTIIIEVPAENEEEAFKEFKWMVILADSFKKLKQHAIELKIEEEELEQDEDGRPN